MENNIEHLYNLYSNEIYQNTPEISNVSKDVSKKEDILIETLTEEQREIYYDLMDKVNERGELVDKQIFICAFSLAVNLLVDGLRNDRSKGL